MKQTIRKLGSLADITARNEKRVEQEWLKALPYLRDRGGVVFLSNCRFWERHGQPQRSLATTLTQYQIPTTWFDGRDRGGYSPVFTDNSPLLQVRTLPSLPGERYSLIMKASRLWQTDRILSTLRAFPKKPLLWVQAGFDSEIITKLPYLDVYSYFDDLFAHQPGDALFQRAKVVLTQNDYGAELYGQNPKIHRLFPPLEVSAQVLGQNTIPNLPSGFPSRRMGYIGSLFAGYFDFDLLEKFIVAFPGWGFVIGGRVDEAATARIDALSRFPNFKFLPWIERSQVSSYWKLLDVCLLLYRPQRAQLGSFATKALESLYYGVPIVAVDEPKTEVLGHYFPVTSDSSELMEAAVKLGTEGSPHLEAAFEYLVYEMHPKRHLAQVVKWLEKK